MLSSFPQAPRILLRNAAIPRVVLGVPVPGPGALALVDILIANGQIERIVPAGTALEGAGAAVFDCDLGLVLPTLVDIHTHLDKGHIWPRKPNPDGSFMGALQAVDEDRQGHWDAADVERRMDFAIRCAYAHGTAAIRTHIDFYPPQHEISWEVFDRVRDRWAGKVDLQAVALVGPNGMREKAVYRQVAVRAKSSGGLLGGAIAVDPHTREAMFNAVEIAGELGLELDIHVDETLDEASSALRHLADAVIETGFAGRVLAGHCCVLAVQPRDVALATIDRVAEAGISVVSLPMCNLYLQHRRNDPLLETPRFRGVTLVNELKAAGVKVALASDNTRDPFYAYGDLDGLEVFREGARIAHFDHPQADAWDWLAAISTTASAIAGFGARGTIAEGLPADLILVRARHWTELHSRPQTDRIVLRAGKAIDTAPPDYRELDDLMR